MREAMLKPIFLSAKICERTSVWPHEVCCDADIRTFKLVSYVMACSKLLQFTDFRLAATIKSVELP